MLGPKYPKPASEDVRAGLIGGDDDFVLAGTYRRGQPEYRTDREFWFGDRCIPKGFTFDRYSLPWFLRPWQPKSLQWAGPSLLHDKELEFGELSIKEANRLFLQAMKDIGVAWHHRSIAYRGVEFARRFFPDRITRVDPDNVELIERVTGQPVGDRVGKLPRPDRSALLGAAARVGTIALKAKGVI